MLIVTWLHWASAARITAELIAAGVNVDVVCSDFHPILTVRGVSKWHRYKRAAPLLSLIRAIERSAPELIVAGDDVAIGHLQSIRRSGRPELAELIEHSLGPAESYDIIASRARFIASAQSAGADAPDCVEIAAPAELSLWLDKSGLPAFLKLDGTCGGEGVRLLRDAEDVAAAITSMRRSPATLGGGTERIPAISVQKAVNGQPANCSAFAWRGEVMAVLSVVTLETLHDFGIATIVRPVESPAMRRAAVLIARALNLSGFFGLDFILQEGGLRAWVLELNPRPTPISHLALGAGRDLVAALISKVNGRPQEDRPVAFPPDANISIFPHLLRRRLAEMQQMDDWPTGQPGLVRAFTRRQKIADYRARLDTWWRPRGPSNVRVRLDQSSEIAGN